MKKILTILFLLLSHRMYAAEDSIKVYVVSQSTVDSFVGKSVPLVQFFYYKADGLLAVRCDVGQLFGIKRDSVTIPSDGLIALFDK